MRPTLARALPVTIACALAFAAVPSAAATTDLGLSPFQAQTAWPGPHRDMRNSDSVPYATATSYEIDWRAEETNMTLWAFSMGPEGNLYVATGRAGDPNLHAYASDGTLLWETGIPVAESDPNPVSAAVSPFIDVDGNIYLSDNAFFWSFDATGSLRWKTALPLADGLAQAFVGSPVLTDTGLVGGITNRGQVRFYDRASGALAVPVFELPGGAAPAGDPTPGGLWGGGELDSSFVDVFWAGFNGFELEVANTPAVHPDTDRIYITATSSTSASEGALYGLDLVGGEWQIAFESPLGVNSGTSPAISPDGTQVYAVGGNEELAAYDADTGALLWTNPNASAVASPTVGPDGKIYTGSSSGLMVAIHQDGSTAWTRSFHALAEASLPTLAPFGNILTTGFPVAQGDSIPTITNNRILVAIKLGYEFQPPGGDVNVIPNIVLLCTLSPVDGRLLDTAVMPDDSRGLISVAPSGRVYTSHAAAFTSIFFYSANFFVPDDAKILSAPAAGVTAWRPASFLQQVGAGIETAKGFAEDAAAALALGDTASAQERIVAASIQLAASSDSWGDADDEGEIDTGEAATRAASTGDAQTHVDAARAELDTMPLTQTEIDAAVAELDSACTEMGSALDGIACDDRVLCSTSDVYTQTTCSGVAASPVTSLKLTIKLSGGLAESAKDKASFKAVFPIAELTGNPDETGLRVQIVRADGLPVHDGTVPAASFVDKKGDDTKFTFKDKSGVVSGADGIAKLSVKVNANKGEVQVKGLVVGSENGAADGQTELSLSLLFGNDPLADDCIGSVAMTCTSKPGKRTGCVVRP